MPQVLLDSPQVAPGPAEKLYPPTALGSEEDREIVERGLVEGADAFARL